MLTTGMLLLAGAAGMQEAAPTTADKPAKEKKICRAAVRTGSIMPTRICLTKAEWKEFQEHNERDNEEWRNKKNYTLNPSALG